MNSGGDGAHKLRPLFQLNSKELRSFIIIILDGSYGLGVSITV